MKTIRSLLALLMAACLAVPAWADVESAVKRFESIKGLAGTWRGYKQGDKTDILEVEFRVVSGGSAVAQRLMPGTKWEMLRVFSRDRDQIMVTHYCMLGNQSNLRAVESDDNSHFDFGFVRGANFSEKDELHLHRITWKMNGSTDLVESFEMFDSGIKTDGATYLLKRVRQSR